MALVVAGTDFIQMPAGTTAQRPGVPAQGMQRYNTTLGYTEVYTGSAWVQANLPAPGTNGNVLTSNGTAWISSTGGVTAQNCSYTGTLVETGGAVVSSAGYPGTFDLGSNRVMTGFRTAYDTESGWQVLYGRGYNIKNTAS
jgi:hypothetical protein